MADHASQVSLPGGAVEPGETAAQAAIREFHEELGADGLAIDFLGTLSPLYVQASNYLVTPCVAAARSRPRLVPNPAEVEEVLEVPLGHLLDPAHFGSQVRQYEGRTYFAPHFLFQSHRIWVRTCMILGELVTLLEESTIQVLQCRGKGRGARDERRGARGSFLPLSAFGFPLYRSPFPLNTTLPRTIMRAVVFDMDGLMFNTEDVYTAVGTELLRRRGLVFTAELKDLMMGRPPQPAFEVLIGRCHLTETWQQLAAESDRLFLSLLNDYLAPMPGLYDLLDALERAAIPKAIATSSDRELVQRLSEAVRACRNGSSSFSLPRHCPRQATPGNLSDRRPAFRCCPGRNGGVGG